MTVFLSSREPRKMLLYTILISFFLPISGENSYTKRSVRQLIEERKIEERKLLYIKKNHTYFLNFPQKLRCKVTRKYLKVFQFHFKIAVGWFIALCQIYLYTSD